MNAKEMVMGTHAPLRNFTIDAEKYKDSISPKKTKKQNATEMLFFQHNTITKDIKHVVTSITVITAKPEALPNCFVSRNPMVTDKQRTINIQLISGM